MANPVHVQPDKLDTFIKEIQKTPVMLENVFAENRDMITKTMHNIGMISDMLAKKRAAAQDELEQAEAMLAKAEGDTAFYSELVWKARDRLSEISTACDRGRKAGDDYSIGVERYKRDERKYFEEYISLLKKGNARLARYAELVRLSGTAITEG